MEPTRNRTLSESIVRDLMGTLRLAIFLAYKSIFKGNRWALLLILLVMSLSFANLLLTPSILLGVTDAMNRQRIDTTYGHVVIDPVATEYYIGRTSEIEAAVARIPVVTGVSPRLTSSALIEYQWKLKDAVDDRGRSGAWRVVGIDPVSEAGVTTIHHTIIDGSYLDPGDRGKILLGIEIAGGERSETADFQTLQGAEVGDTVRLTYPNGVQREYEIKGLFQARDIAAADHTAFVTRTEMASVLGREVYADRTNQIVVRLDDPAFEARTTDEIRALGFPVEVRGWHEYSGALSGVVSSFDIVASLISGIGLVVAGIVMFIVIYINIIHSRRHIGILRAIGIRRGAIIGSYLAQALFYAALGIIAGGMLFGFGLQAYFSHYPLDLSIGQVSLVLQPSTVLQAVAGLIAAGIFAGLVPVLHITRQGIIHAIWGN